MDLRDLISLAIIALAAGALWSTGRKGAKGAAMLLGAAAVGAIVSQLFTSAAAHRINQVLSPPPVSDQSSPGLPSNSLVEDPQPRTDLPAYTPAPEPYREAATTGSLPIGSTAPTVRKTAPRTPERRGNTAPPTLGGGLEVVVQGSLNASAPDEVESAIFSELQSTGWGGFSSGGYKRLRVSGSLRDLDLTLGQIPTASISATWVLQSASGQVIAQGGMSDLRGTGIDQEGARTAALAWAARNIAVEITRRIP
jgi:hypothetical protein